MRQAKRSEQRGPRVNSAMVGVANINKNQRRSSVGPERAAPMAAIAIGTNIQGSINAA